MKSGVSSLFWLTVLLGCNFLACTEAIPTKRFSAHDDVKVSSPTHLQLEQVIMLGRHGNRAPDGEIQHVCPNRTKQDSEYFHQGVVYAGMTHGGIQGILDLGTFTRQTYVDTGFVPSLYDRENIQVLASQSDRTLMSAAAWGLTAFPSAPKNFPLGPYSLPIPVAVASRPVEIDDLLEVRKAKCAARLAEDTRLFDEKYAATISHNESIRGVVVKVEKACGTPFTGASDLTTDGSVNGVPTMDAIKVVADALSADVLEGFPLMEGLTLEDTKNFMDFAESAFHRRLYNNPSQVAYMAGKLPHRMVKLFDRKVSQLSNSTLVESAKQIKGAGPLTLLNDINSTPSPKPIRKFFSFHCHREILYGIAKFLGVRFDVDRPGLPEGLINPSTGAFFELWKDPKLAEKITLERDSIHSDPNRRGSLRFDIDDIDHAYFVRLLVWAPCWKGDGRQYTNDEGEVVCPARARVIPQCGGQEFCSLAMFKRIIENNFAYSGGDYKTQCRDDLPGRVMKALKKFGEGFTDPIGAIMAEVNLPKGEHGNSEKDDVEQISNYSKKYDSAWIKYAVNAYKHKNERKNGVDIDSDEDHDNFTVEPTSNQLESLSFHYNQYHSKKHQKP